MARRCGTLKDVAVGRLAREQLSKRRTVSALEILGEKKPRRSGVEISYGMNLLGDFKTFFFQEAHEQVINRAFIVQVANLNFLG